MKTRVIAGTIIVLAGCFVAAFPWLKAASYEYRKNRVLDKWEQVIHSGETVKTKEPPEPYQNIQEQVIEATLGERLNEDVDEEVWEENTNAPFNAEYVLENMEGVITIDRINLRYPILRGATKYNLDLTVCSLAGSPKMGEPGNYCLAGHNSRVYGRQFSRLTELQKGDTIILSDGVSDFYYKAVQTMKVSPEDIWVLDDTPKENVLTLITCDYTVKPIGRFIVKCVYIEDSVT